MQISHFIGGPCQEGELQPGRAKLRPQRVWPQDTKKVFLADALLMAMAPLNTSVCIKYQQQQQPRIAASGTNGENSDSANLSDVVIHMSMSVCIYACMHVRMNVFIYIYI